MKQHGKVEHLIYRSNVETEYDLLKTNSKTGKRVVPMEIMEAAMRIATPFSWTFWHPVTKRWQPQIGVTLCRRGKW
jgi:hypothetical protein